MIQINRRDDLALRDRQALYSRDHIKIRDRAKLEKRVCECYAVVKKEFDRLLPHEIHTPAKRN